MDRKFGLFKPGLTVLDLGASPGGWSQYACSRVGRQGEVYAVDVLDMQPISGVEFLKSDMSDADAVERVTKWMGHSKAHIIISDMAPNITGNSAIDAENFSDLYIAIFDISVRMLADSGSLAFKFFQTDATAGLRRNAQLMFASSTVCKPKASRTRSQEAYLVAQGYNPPKVAKAPRNQ